MQYESNKESLASAVSEQEAALERAEKELALAFETKDKLEKVLPLYKQEEEAYLKLSESAHVGMLDAIDKTRKRIEKEEEYQAQDLIIAREKAAMEQTQRKIRQLLSDNERQLREQRAQLAEKINRLEAELIKQEHRRSLLELKAPQDGVVKDMATHTVGTVTQPGTILMTLVPLTDTLRAEVWLQNQDVGFVRPGQDVKLKLTAFQFQKYGMVNGNVEHVAADARDAGQQPPGEQSASSANPLTYRTLISLDDQKLFTEMKSYDLFPGMQVMAEIKLGERSVLEYLLSPVRRAFHQAGRER
ncbi:HlyD family secretion protein [Marinobacter persicus]|uniref:Membrane fusion protein (MFP) family protein n=1 Tax=Marinobacter persicus TaxID=930118 RepID=A0A1I3RUG4_9GAMM|nr:HlyD family secretion protein [Marinobacter persicus]